MCSTEWIIEIALKTAILPLVLKAAKVKRRVSFFYGKGEKEPRCNNPWKFSLKSIRCYSRRIRLNATTEKTIFFSYFWTMFSSVFLIVLRHSILLAQLRESFQSAAIQCYHVRYHLRVFVICPSMYLVAYTAPTSSRFSTSLGKREQKKRGWRKR